MSKKIFKALLVFLFTIGLLFPAFADPGVGKLNIWVSALDNPCGIWNNHEKDGWRITILDCDGIFKWDCGTYLNPEGDWQPVPNGIYANIPFRCGHLEVKLPPGTYWVVAAIWAGNFEPGTDSVRFNKSTHVGIAQVKCDKATCLKLFNPSIKLCWTWFKYGMYMNSFGGQGGFPIRDVRRIDKLVSEMMRDVPMVPAERNIIKLLDKQIMKVQKKRKK